MRIAAIADIHGNLPALETVLEDCKRQSIGQYIFLGDYITDGPFSNEVLDIVRSMDAVVVSGNRETRTLKLGPTETSQKVMAAAYATRDHLREDSLDYIQTLKEETEIEFEGVRFHISHHPTHYHKHENGIWDMADIPKILTHASADITLFGHTHRQLLHSENGKHVFNPGSVGLALNSDPRAHYGIITIKDGNINNGSIEFETLRLDYDREAYLEAIRTSGLLEESPLWTQCTLRSIETGNNYYVDLLGNAKALMAEHGRSLENWIDDDIWAMAGEQYDFSKTIPATRVDSEYIIP